MTDVIVIGSGLSGMSAAVQLADAGLAVKVLEANPFIGGRTASWVEEGMPVETGLHRFLGFYTALPDLIKKVGVELDDILCWEDEVEIRSPRGDEATLGASPLHKPLKTIWSLLGHNDFLPPTDKLALNKMFAAGLARYHSEPLKLDAISVLEYAKHHGVSDKAVQNILVPLTEGIFFVDVSEYSMHNLIGLVAPYITAMHKLRVGAFMGGMTDVMMQPMADYVRNREGMVLTNCRVEKLLVEDRRVVGVLANTQEYRAKHIVIATQLQAAKDLLNGAFPKHPHFKNLQRLPTMPSVTFQIELSRPSMDLDRTTFGPGTILASFAEQSRTTFRHVPGRISVILSSPEKYLRVSPDAVLKQVQADAKKLDIDLTDNVVQYRKVNLPQDFYSLKTGSEALRPTQATPIPGLTLAGDYTKQKNLATMEGAVVSGIKASQIVLESL